MIRANFTAPKPIKTCDTCKHGVASQAKDFCRLGLWDIKWGRGESLFHDPEEIHAHNIEVSYRNLRCSIDCKYYKGEPRGE